MTTADTLERLATRGTARGADVVLDAARATAIWLPERAAPRPRRILLTAAVALTAAAVITTIVLVWPSSGGQEQEPVDTGPATSVVAPSVPQSPDTSGPAPPGSPADGPIFGAPLGTTLIFSGQNGSLTALDLDTGLARRFPDHGGGITDAAHLLVRIGNTLYYPDSVGLGVRSIPVDLSTSGAAVPGIRRVIPSGRDGRAWLETQGDDGTSGTVREVDDDGTVTVPDMPLPTGFGPEAAAGDLLLLVRYGWTIPPTPRAAELWNPRTGEVVREFDEVQPFSSSGTLFALGSDCDGTVEQPGSAERCSTLTLLDVVTGSEVTVDLSTADIGLPAPDGGAAFSPDRSQLALWGPFGNAGQQLVIVEVATGTVRLVTDLHLADADLGNNGVTWSPDSTRLFTLSGDGSTLGTIDTASGESVVLRTSAISADALVAVPAADGPELGATGEAPPCVDQLVVNVLADCVLLVDPVG